ncbi:hypothetical protein [Tahibacter harae]|uniref:Uncharacterized protein n=1 Tax=Tahibacter harae TaxID=2963937 RepID=A0ABT1QPI6_9GAMM|nr:hypothetical protein [Tahibacter harae]MCQ4164203.1 hypothetical protein [Tahibacter harae]
MAWYSYPLGAALTPEHVAQGARPRELLGALPPEAPHVFAASRRGLLLHRLRQLLAAAGADVDGLYLLQDQAVLAGAELTQQRARIEALLDAVGRNPRLAIEATREAHTPAATVQCEGFEPLACEVVYAPDCRIEEGWVYYCTEDQVRAMLAAAICGPDPRPPADDEGESLQYLFGFLQSQAALLRTAEEAGLCVIYAEMNPAD